MSDPEPEVRRVVVVHGYDAAPDQHWFPWLRDRLAAEGVRTEVVELPEPSFPEAGAWLAAVARAVGEPDHRGNQHPLALLVAAFAEVGGTVYVGGNFTSVQKTAGGGSAQGKTQGAFTVTRDASGQVVGLEFKSLREGGELLKIFQQQGMTLTAP